MEPGASPQLADLHIVNTCSVTLQAASKSRQSIRRTTRLEVLGQSSDSFIGQPQSDRRVVVTGCWATSDRAAAENLPGVDAVLTHSDDVAGELHQLLDQWKSGEPAERKISSSKHLGVGTHSLPLLDQRDSHHQRAFLKIQDGCDAHCTYCIIPQLRPTLWSKPIDDVIEEARRMTAAGHREIVLTGIFLGAYGQETALRRRQRASGSSPLVQLVRELCTRVKGLDRVRFSSLEPGDLSDRLLAELRSHPQIVPHFHLPLQSGSELLLRRMNRQYSRDDFLRMIDDVHLAFDRPAITTDVIVGFPGETDAEFEQTLQVVDRARFIHIHAFSYSPRPGTAAARWDDRFIHGPVVNDRIRQLNDRAAEHSFAYRKQFVGETVELLVEQSPSFETLHHGRCERYFDVHFEDTMAQAGDRVHVLIERVSPQRTFGRRL